MPDHGKINTHALLHHGIIKLLHNTCPVALIGETAEGFLKIILAVGILDMGQELTRWFLLLIRSLVALIFSG